MAALHAAAFTTPRPWTEAEFASLLASPNLAAVTRDDGFAIARIAGPEAELLTIAVAPLARRRGCATALLAELTQTLSRRGATEIFIEVAADNAPALSLYRRHGFAEIGRRARYYVGPDGAVDAILMRRALGQPG